MPPGGILRHYGQGHGNDFFLGGGQNVDMSSDCQNLGGGTGISIPLRQKVGGGNCPPSPPPAPAPLLQAVPTAILTDFLPSK